MVIDKTKLDDPALLAATASGHARLGFSQLGEDAVLWHLFQSKRDGFYVDVGCHHPYRFSNTAVFSEFYNWSGLNIDVDEDLVAEFRRLRPRDINVCTAVGATAGTAEVTLFHETAVNSLDPDTIEEFKKHFAPKTTRIVPMRRLSDLLAVYLPQGKPIDLMSIDVEGLDYEVLTSNDWDLFRPQVLAVEAHNFNLSDPPSNKTFQFLRDKGYVLNSHVVVTSIYTRA